MTTQNVSDPTTPIGDLLRAAGSDGLLLTSDDQTRYALIPLDDDLLDYLIERSPKLVAECQKIRERMQAGHYRTHDEVKRSLVGD
mgnify:CR=1 FL=1